jgi:hypothetical protein
MENENFESEIETVGNVVTVSDRRLSNVEERALAWRNGLVSSLTGLAKEASVITIDGCAKGASEGAKAVRVMRLRLRSHRLPIQAEAKALKDIGRDIVKKVGEIEVELIGIIAGEEKRLEREEDGYEAEKARIKFAAEQVQKEITAQRFIQMQALNVRPLDLGLCQTATEDAWEEYIEAWTEQKARADRELERERIKAETEAKAKREEEEATKAKEQAIQAEREKVLEAERAENARLREDLAKMKADIQAKAQKLADDELAERLKKEELDSEAIRIQLIESDRLQAIHDAPDLEKLNRWRLAVKTAVESVGIPVFASTHVDEVFKSEYRNLLYAIPEIFPFI